MSIRVPLIAVLVLACSIGHAVEILYIDAPQDNFSVRQAVLEDKAAAETRMYVLLIASRGIIDRRRENKDRNIPDSSELFSRAELKKRLGKGKVEREWKPEDYAVPCTIGWLNQLYTKPKGLKLADAEWEFFELEGVGGIHAAFSKEGLACSPVFVFLRTDKDFIPLKKKEDLPSRLEWELTKLKKLKEWLKIPEKIARNKEGDFFIEFPK